MVQINKIAFHYTAFSDHSLDKVKINCLSYYLPVLKQAINTFASQDNREIQRVFPYQTNTSIKLIQKYSTAKKYDSPT